MTPRGGCVPPTPPLAKDFFEFGFDFCSILVEIGSVPEHPPEALVAAIGSGSSVQFGITEQELWSSILSPV